MWPKEIVLVIMIIIILSTLVSGKLKSNKRFNNPEENSSLDKYNDLVLFNEKDTFKRYQKRYKHDIEWEEWQPKEASCDKDFYKQFEKSVFELKKVMCQPKMTAIHVRFSAKSYLRIKTVAVNRCSGMCNMFLLCTPLIKRKKKIYLHIPHKEFGSFCATIDVEEHIECQCDCKINEINCKTNELLNLDSCTCECDEDKIKSCRKKDLNNCRCK